MYQPCCWVPFSRSVSSKDELRNAQITIQEKVESNINQHCQECIRREQTEYSISGRNLANQLIPDDAVDGDAYMLEYQIDTNCNAACSICSEKFSSLWAGSTRDFSQQYSTMFDIVSFDKVTQIKFFGGEPLLGNHHKEVLDQIPNPSNVGLLYSTNGSIIPSDDTLELWTKFKQVRISFSIDDINERFNYIRWPLTFNKIDSNIKKFLDLSNITVSVHCTVNPLSLMFINELDHWVQQLGLPISYSPCFGNLGIDQAPIALREQAHRVLSADHPVLKILNSHPYTDRTVTGLIQSLNKLDQLRGLDWKQTFPGIDNLLR